MNNEPFVIERTYNAPIEKVWKALTDKEQMKQWYFNIAAFKPEVGFEFSFDGGSKEKTYTHLCRVLEVIPNKKLSYSWHYKDYEGNSVVTFELFDEDGKTRLKLTHAGLETFAEANNPDFDPKNFEMGWTAIIGTNLQQYLED